MRLATHLALFAVLAAIAVLALRFVGGAPEASADDWVPGQVNCPTPTPGTPAETNTPAGPTKAPSPTGTHAALS